jgi:hypothetical protein
MSTKTAMAAQVAAQIDRQWPYSRLNVTSTDSGEYVTVGPNSVQLTDDYWYVPREGRPNRRFGYAGEGPTVISDTLMEAVAHNGRTSVRDRVTAFDVRCSVHHVGLVYVIELPTGKDAVIAPLDGGITLAYGERTHWMPTIGHAIGAVGAILSQE